MIKHIAQNFKQNSNHSHPEAGIEKLDRDKSF